MSLDAFLHARQPFVSRRWVANGHAMTLFTWARRRNFPDLPNAEARVIQTAPETQVLAHCYWQTDRARAPTLLVLHGLEGSSQAHYMRGLAAKAWRRGWNAVLLNQRNCGGTEHLSPTLYHSGLTDDPREVIRHLVREDGIQSVGVVGYSLGGNLTVKLAAELEQSPDLPIAGVVAISPTIDLEQCVRAIERRRNIVYELNFVRNLKGRIRRMARIWPGRYDLSPLRSVWTIRRFDELYTAPCHGFGGASDYYHQVSAIRVADRIRIPTLILTATDDPFVPAAQFEEPAVKNNPCITVWLEANGGHCGFACAPDPRGGHDGYWAEATAVEFLAAVMRA
jgi:uncharacterized protein